MCTKSVYEFRKKRSTASSLSCKKKLKKLASSSIALKAKNSSYTSEYCCWSRERAWSAININSLSSSTIEHFGKSPIGAGVEANWPPNAFMLRYWACDRLTENADLVKKKKKIIFWDEAHFDLGGYVNKQNSRLWGTKIHWKADKLKTSRCLVRILVQ